MQLLKLHIIHKIKIVVVFRKIIVFKGNRIFSTGLKNTSYRQLHVAKFPT